MSIAGFTLLNSVFYLFIQHFSAPKVDEDPLAKISIPEYDNPSGASGGRPSLIHTKSLDKLQRMQIDLNRKREMKRKQEEGGGTGETPTTSIPSSSSETTFPSTSELHPSPSSGGDENEGVKFDTQEQTVDAAEAVEKHVAITAEEQGGDAEVPSFFSSKYRKAVQKSKEAGDAEGDGDAGPRIKPAHVNSVSKLQRMQLEVSFQTHFIC